MKLRLLDYAGEEYFCEVPDNTEQVTIDIITGDMVMVDPVYFDTSNDRMMDFYDGTMVLNKEEFHKLEKINKSYDLFMVENF